MSRFIFLLFLLLPITLKAQKPTLKSGLQRFVDENTIYPMFALDNCIQGNLEVAFKLNSKGEVTYATISKGVGADLDAEALRLIKLSSGKWELPENYDTKFLLRAPMEFTLKGFGCEEVNAATIGLALNRYRESAIKIDKISTYYKNAYQDLPNMISESKITEWKTELEIDEDFLAKKIAIGERKIKQGDFKSACEDFTFVKYMGSAQADLLLAKYCK